MSILLGVSFTSLIALYSYQLVTDNHRELANERLYRLGSNLERSFYKRVSITNALEAFVQAYADTDLSEQQQFKAFKKNFEDFIGSLNNQVEGLSSIQLAPGGVVTFLTNPEEHDKALGHDLLKDEARREQVLATIEKRMEFIAGPLNLIQGGEAVIARQAIFTKPNVFSAERYRARWEETKNTDWLKRIPDDFWGLAIVLIDTKALYREAGLNNQDKHFQFAIRGRHGLGEKGAVFWGDRAVFENPLSSVQVTLPSGYWVVAAQLKRQPIIWYPLAIIFMGLIGTGLLVYTVYDIAKRQQAEEALMEAVASQKAILAAVPDLLCELDEDGQYLNIWTHDPQELVANKESQIGSTVSEVLPPAAAAIKMAALKEAKEKGESHGQQIQLTTRNGKKWYELSTSLKDKNSSPQRFIMLSRDINERKKAEEKLRQAAAVFENATDGVIITDAQAKIVNINDAIEEMMGYSEAEVLGKNPMIFTSDRYDSSYFQDVLASLKRYGKWRSEVWSQRKNGEAFPCWQSISTVLDNDTGDVQHYVSIVSDISAVKESENRLQHLAHHDPLTDLPNRLLFGAQLKRALEYAQQEKSRVGVMFLDLDNFKAINDGLGHPMGDKVLQAVAERLTARVREEDTVARISGDEFAIILENISNATGVELVAKKILTALEFPIYIDGHKLHVTISIGISLYPDDGKDVNTLVKNADTAMYQAKEQGKNRYSSYNISLTETALKRLKLENELRVALERDEFRVYYQPQYSLTTGKLVGAEALLRWQHPEMGLVHPGEFVSLAESTGLIVRIGEWVLREACAQTVAWLDAGLDIGRIGINVAGRQIERGAIVNTVRDVLEETGLKAKYVELEITETFIMQHAEKAITTLGELQDLGVTLAIDDFGTGYSSLSYLKHLPINKLKIDRSFVKGLPQDTNDESITRAIIALGKSLQLNIIAEGVETKEQNEFFRREGCNEVQGFYYSPPLSEEDFADFFKKA